jgi:hypothetical protein
LAGWTVNWTSRNDRLEHLVNVLQRAARTLHDRQVAALRVAHDEVDLLELAADEARDDLREGDDWDHREFRLPMR